MLDFAWRQGIGAARQVAALTDPATAAYTYATRLADPYRVTPAATATDTQAFCFRMLVRRVYGAAEVVQIRDPFLRSIVLAVYVDHPVEAVDPADAGVQRVYHAWRASVTSVEAAYLARRYAVPAINPAYDAIADIETLAYIYEQGALSVAAAVKTLALVIN